MFRKLKLRFAGLVTLLVGAFLLLLMSTVISVSISVTNRTIRSEHNQTLDSLWQCNFNDKTVKYGNNVQIIIFDRATYSATYSIIDNETEKHYANFLAQELASSNLDDGKDSELVTVEDRCYYYTYRVDVENDRVCFAVSDYTLERVRQNQLIEFLVIGFICGLAMAFAISIVLSTETVKPIQKAFDKQKELIANASHELKTPIAIIDASLSNILDDDLSKTVASQKKWLENIKLQSIRMNGLVVDMLELAKMEKLVKKENLIVTDVSEIVEGILLSNDARCYDKEITFDYEVVPNVKLSVVPEYFDRLVSVLVDNAIKYTPKNGTIKVTLTENKKKAELKIRNSGIGILPEHLDKIFDRFYKVDDSRNSNGAAHSYGLGLSIAKGIVEAMDGTIRAESVYESYTEFIVEFPIKQ